jgi:hypothetical protein
LAKKQQQQQQQQPQCNISTNNNNNNKYNILQNDTLEEYGRHCHDDVIQFLGIF